MNGVEINSKEYSAKFLVSYTLTNLAYKDKIRFYYALYGRDGKSGMARELHIEQLSRAVIMANKKQYPELIEFLEYWKVRYVVKRIFIKANPEMKVNNQLL